MPFYPFESVCLTRRGVSRRGFFQAVSATALATGTLSFRDLLTVRADDLRRQGRSLILLWMQGGPSQLETFDPKPGHPNGGPTTAIDTATPGIRIAQGWEQTAKVLPDIALIRSLTNKEGQHQRATYQLHTGYLPSGSVKYPNLGCSIAREIAPHDTPLPAVVSIGPTEGAGFLGVDYEPFVVQAPGQLPRHAATAVDRPRFEKRLGLLQHLEADFALRGGEQVVKDHQLLYGKTSRFVLSPEVKAFDISGESEAIKAQYGNSDFGRGCLVARRLVEAGVTFVEVRTSNRWDTHRDNFTAVARNAQEVDPAFATLITDLKQRGLLERTLVVWAGEFGRTPLINPNTGRDHYPRVCNAALAGAGVKGGQVIGSSSADGMSIETDPVTVPDLLTSVCSALKVNPTKENISPLGRPIKIVDGGQVIPKLFS